MEDEETHKKQPRDLSNCFEMIIWVNGLRVLFPNNELGGRRIKIGEDNCWKIVIRGQ